jgi:biopolymer transport protein TolR
MGANFSSDGPISQINVTPLVDVMLVLLVIFMVTAPMLQQGVEVKLPKATTAPLSGSAEQIVLSIDKTGQTFLGAGNAVPIDQVGTRVAAALSNRPVEARKIYIKADTDLPYGRIMTVMGRLHSAGVTQIGLISAPVTGEGGGASGKGSGR